MLLLLLLLLLLFLLPFLLLLPPLLPHSGASDLTVSKPGVNLFCPFFSPFLSRTLTSSSFLSLLPAYQKTLNLQKGDGEK
ncbi:hypothetical protein LZ31DRAFT_554191 [Colletotrichum somersetense]|nr:hypothetical protein LZ31DRAFT_554191 [Colletotrichum somersetense]